MDWSAIWDWLSHSGNQATLVFLGGGVVVVVTGIFAIFKFRRSGGEKKPSSLTVTADRGGVAAGRDAHVTGNDARPKQR